MQSSSQIIATNKSTSSFLQMPDALSTSVKALKWKNVNMWLHIFKRTINVIKKIVTALMEILKWQTFITYSMVLLFIVTAMSQHKQEHSQTLCLLSETQCTFSGAHLPTLSLFIDYDKNQATNHVHFHTQEHVWLALIRDAPDSNLYYPAGTG